MDPTTILTQARCAIEATTRRVADLLRSLPDLAMPVENSDWTVREAAVHLVNFYGIYTDIAQGMASPIRDVSKEAFAAENNRRIADIPEKDPERLAALLLESVDGFLETTSSRSGEQPVVFHAGIPLDLAGLAGVALGELLLHGYDMATTVGAPWPMDPLDAQFVLYGYAPAYGYIVNPKTAQGFTAGFGIEVRGGGSFTIRFTDGVYSVEPPDSGPIDCTISTDPLAFLLVGSGRLSRWPAISLGLIAAGGPRPELALGFVDLFVYP